MINLFCNKFLVNGLNENIIRVQHHAPLNHSRHSIDEPLSTPQFMRRLCPRWLGLLVGILQSHLEL